MEHEEQIGKSAAEESQPKEQADSAVAGSELFLVEESLAEEELEAEVRAPDVSTAESATPELEPLPKPRRRTRLRRGLYGLGGLLIVFLLGAGLVGLLLYRPAQLELDEANEQLRDAEERIGELEDQVATLELLPDQLDESSRHAAVLGVLADVNAARLALAGGETASARLYLSATPERLTRLTEALGKEHEPVTSAMQQRLDLITKEISSEPEVAQNDLDALANQLMQLEMTFLELP
jgi:hypothetical protein